MRHFSKYDLSTGERVYIERVNRKSDFSSDKQKTGQKHKRRLIQDEDEKLLHNHNSGRDILLQELSEEKTALETLLEEKMDRWVYLNDLAERIQAQEAGK